MESLEQHGLLSLEPQVRKLVLAMSSVTIDRLLAPNRKASGGNNWRRPPRAYSAVRRRVPVRTFKGWDNQHEPGWLEIDLVAHCGGRMQGPFLWTLVATDIATGWSESVPILVRDGAVVLTALQLIRRQLPFPLRGIDADNDPVFMNSLMATWCDQKSAQSRENSPYEWVFPQTLKGGRALEVRTATGRALKACRQLQGTAERRTSLRRVGH